MRLGAALIIVLALLFRRSLTRRALRKWVGTLLRLVRARRLSRKSWELNSGSNKISRAMLSIAQTETYPFTYHCQRKASGTERPVVLPPLRQEGVRHETYRQSAAGFYDCG